jgi:hypothetical protein
MSRRILEVLSLMLNLIGAKSNRQDMSDAQSPATAWPYPEAKFPSCSYCRHFGGTLHKLVLRGITKHNWYGHEAGYCQRYPPLHRATYQKHQTMWPLVDSVEICGEFSAKDDTEQK